MNTLEFSDELEARIGKYDLRRHPFYKAWSAGKLTRNDLREYAQEYYHYVHAIPSSLAALALRLEDGELRRAVLEEMCDEKGAEGRPGMQSVPHAELWLDFAEGMGSSRNLEWHTPVREIRQLIRHYYQIASEASPEEALAAFYTYESQVPRVAKEREQSLRQIYGADDKTCGYFTLHANPEFGHARFLHRQLKKQIAADPTAAQRVLQAAENAALMFWKALDGIYSRIEVVAA